MVTPSIFLVFMIFVYTTYSNGSLSCGVLISVDGWRYDLTPLSTVGQQQINYLSWDGNISTVLFAVCGPTKPCGECTVPGVCLIPDTCYGEYSLEFFHPLMYGVGVQFEYYEGDPGLAGFLSFTVFTIACGNTPGFSDVQVDDNTIQKISIKMRSLAGCPAHGGYPPSFPYQYQFSKYIYRNNPSSGVVEDNYALDSSLGKLRRGKILLDSTKDQNRLYNWGDSDKYHNLSCYYVPDDEAALPFSLPNGSSFLGTNNTSVYDPTSGKFYVLETDQWEYSIDNCTNKFWFKSGMAIPVQELTCNGVTTVYFDFKLGQPDGSIFNPPDDCYEYQTCGAGWDTCKYPYCCFEGNTCIICGQFL